MREEIAIAQYPEEETKVIPFPASYRESIEVEIDHEQLGDEELVERIVQQSDQKACAEIVRRYRKWVNYAVLRVVYNRHDAEDVTIEALAKAFISIDQYLPKYKFSTWINTIAVNKGIDFLRKKKPRTVSLDEWSDDPERNQLSKELQANEPLPDEQLARKQRARQLYRAMKSLRPRYRQLIKLRYFKEYDYLEIAEELNIPLGSVKAQLFRAKGELYELLQSPQEQNGRPHEEFTL